ncbi:transposase [Sinorhizobium meliloti]|nr:transposase [Sinorhizobium meliloti]MDX0753260.1 transposase [Sinorhizobium medicae]MDX0079498.1 transposase [Sinorhizobium meliloti]MDX0759786.1 transposase [Sinorhizobium medicae]MDX0796477.1 transposase [Sinorhizobium medicae]
MAVFDVGNERSGEARSTKLEDKWRIVEEAQLPGNSVAEVARRRGVNSNLLFRWIRAAEAGQLGHRPDSLVLLPQPALDFIRCVWTRR